MSAFFILLSASQLRGASFLFIKILIMYKLILTLIILTVIVFVAGAVTMKTDTTLGSVSIGGEYQASTTYNYLGAVNMQQTTVLLSNPGTLGSVIITGANTGTIKLYDKASVSTGASTTIATFPASTAAGTYVFDTYLRSGLIVEFSSATALPTTTITFRSSR